MRGLCCNLHFSGHILLFCSIDASREDDSLGRLVNDDHRHPNCKMKRIGINQNPHLCLFALNDIKEGEEITYDYGGEDCQWRNQVCYTFYNLSKKNLHFWNNLVVSLNTQTCQ